MKIVNKATLSFMMVISSSCNYLSATPAIGPLISKTATAVPTLSSTSLPTVMPLPPTETRVPEVQNSPIVIVGTAASISLENGLTWTECALPYRDYFHNRADIDLITSCLGMELPSWDENDKAKYGQRIRGENGDNLQLIIGGNTFETRYTQSDAHDYELVKNGDVLARASAHIVTFDPNRSLGYLGGKIVWEIIAEPPVLIIDGVNTNEEFQLEGSFFPYEIKGKLIYLAKQNGKFHIVYDGKTIGPEYDEISMAYCCSQLSVSFGKGQYWFLGRRDSAQYIVAIH